MFAVLEGPNRLLIGFVAAASSVAVLFIAGWTYEAFKKRRSRPIDPYWSQFRHAYGDASDLPELFARLKSEGDAVIWNELWSRLCHQGRAGTTGSVAAVPMLVEFAASVPPRERCSALALVGAIAADADGVLVPDDVRSNFTEAMARTSVLSLKTLPLTKEPGEFASVLGALAAAEGCPILAREVVAFVEQELQLECPHCDAYITVATDREPWVAQCDGYADGTIEAPRSDSWPALLKYRDLSSQYGMSELAAWIDRLRAELRCPACSQSFVIADVLNSA